MNTIKYAPLTAQTYWQFAITGISAGTSFSNSQTQQDISDTGTSLIGGPQSQIQSIATALGATYNGQYQLYLIPCNKISTLPPVSFTINVPAPTVFQIPADQYAIDVGIGGGQCLLSFFPFNGGGMGPSWILGDTWLRPYCNVYDVGNKRIGFAVANH